MRRGKSELVTRAPIALVNPFVTSRERYGKDIGDIGGYRMLLGIRTTGFFMETYRFALPLPLSDVVVTINTPIPGTESYEKARDDTGRKPEGQA